jgi:integrase
LPFETFTVRTRRGGTHLYFTAPDGHRLVSTAGWLGRLPGQLVTLLRKHREEQARGRADARQLREDGGWMFSTPTGPALNPNTDYHQWKDLLKAAGLRDARLHDARHTAATVLLILGVPMPTVMSITGWASADMARRYRHVTHPIRQAVAEQGDGLLRQIHD